MMTPQEYDDQKDIITKVQEDSLRVLRREYASKNNKVRKGMYAKQHGDQILVDKLHIFMSHVGYPLTAYSGVMITKKGIPYKSGERHTIYPHDVNKVETSEEFIND